VAVLPEDLTRALEEVLSLERAVETGTHVGAGAAKLADIFPSVVSIEVSERFHREAKSRLAGRSEITLMLGDSVEVLPEVQDPATPTFFWLDGHWTPTDARSSAEGGGTGVGSIECPVVDEIALLADGHPDDCIIVDDARIFAVAPPPPHDPEQWPSTLEVLDALRTARPHHHITLAADYFIAVPLRARQVLDDVARRWMTHQGWASDKVPMKLTDEGWLIDPVYHGWIQEELERRLDAELARRDAELVRRSLRARVGRTLGRR
jgi:hypothetical protein